MDADFSETTSPSGRPWSELERGLFADLPFNLAGESQSSELTAEAEARVRALAESEARKAQLTFEPLDRGPLEGELFIGDNLYDL